MSVHFAANLVIGSPWSRVTSNLPFYFSCTMSQTRAARSACVSGVTTFTGGEDDGEEEEEEGEGEGRPRRAVTRSSCPPPPLPSSLTPPSTPRKGQASL